jgi:small-conductance mechanosensitive channel
MESLTGIILTLKYIYPLLKTKRFRVKQKRNVVYTRIIALSIFVLNIIALVANATGYENLAGYSTKLGVYAGVLSIFALGLQQILMAVFQVSIYVLNIYYPNIVSRYGVTIFNRSKNVLNVLIGYFWISGILHIAEFWETVSSIITNIFVDKVKIGSLSFTFGKLVLFIAVLYFTYILAKFTKRIFEREILAKHKMKRGMAASISLSIRIFLVFFGTLIALSVSGMDLSKIGIIAGALSVGIGFGLQNIVSNFISGLILVYEKPVQEGDTIEVDTLLGRVSNIGTRSSTITTYDGAEVVVPNSNLISNQLINWTLSDNKKRIEVKVGVSYKSDPHLVLDLLLKAALSHKRVLRDPSPQPLFVGFGENSLNFRLLFWVRFEEGLATQSDVVLKIYDILKENNIEIPFPQLDLHVKNP